MILKAKTILALLICSAALVGTGGCAMQQQASDGWVTEKTLIRVCDKGPFRYKVYLMPAASSEHAGRHSRKEKIPLVLSIMIINKDGGVSPLRGSSSNLEQYSVLYEYLLNKAKNDFVLLNGRELEYPVYYAFENNYNAFPFETINIGYPGSTRPSTAQLKNLNLLYMDKVFSHDTLLINLGKTLTL